MLVATMANSSYQNLFILMSLEKNFDEDLFIVWIYRNRYVSWIICALYTLAVLLIHRWMKSRPPVEFGALVLTTWNALFAICNLVIFIKVAPTRLNILWNYGIATIVIFTLILDQWHFGIVFIFSLNLFG